MAARERVGQPLVVLQLVVGVFLIALGLSELVEYNSELNQFARSISRTFGGSGTVVPVIVALVEIAAGALLVAGIFTPVPTAGVFWTSMVIAVLWVLRVVLAYVVDAPFEPTVLVWLMRFTRELLPGLVVWTVGVRFR